MADHRATDFTLKNLRNSYQEYVAPFNSNFHNKTLCESGVMWITRFVTYLSIAFPIYLLIIIQFYLIIIKNVSILTDFTYLVPPSCLCWYSRFEVTWLLRDDSNSKTRVQFVYVLPHILHGDFVYEIKYLVNPQLNILHILTRNVIFFYDYSNWGGLSFNIFTFFM